MSTTRRGGGLVSSHVQVHHLITDLRVAETLSRLVARLKKPGQDVLAVPTPVWLGTSSTNDVVHSRIEDVQRPVKGSIRGRGDR